jgi:hypothetical protein
MLKTVIKEANRVANIIQDETKLGHRFCLSEAMLLTAYWMLWQDLGSMTDQQILNGVKAHFKMSRMSGPRDETGELVDRLLDEKVMVELDKRKYMTVAEILIAVHTGKVEAPKMDPFAGDLDDTNRLYLRNTAAVMGYAVTPEGMLAIATSHHEISKISGRSRGYHLQMQRHPGYIRTSFEKMAGRIRECVVLKDVLDFGEEKIGDEY